MDVYKKTALYLYGLNENDSQWLLEQLPEKYHGKLSPMLSELADLGIPREPTLLSGMESLKKNADQKPSVKEPPYIQRIARTDAAVVYKVLTSEIDTVISVVLQARDWPWKNEIINRFPLQRRLAISEAMTAINGEMTEKVCETLLKIFADRLVDAIESTSPSSANTCQIKEPVRRWTIFGR